MKRIYKKIQHLENMDYICKSHIEWSTTELESDMWNDIHCKIIKLKTYYETDKAIN